MKQKNSDFSERVDLLCLAIGNSRLHWAWFVGNKLDRSWDSEHITDRALNDSLLQKILPSPLKNRFDNIPIYIASVVPSQTKIWLTYPRAKLITLDQIPLENIYPTMGIDRALALLGAGMKLGFPCLVVDAGTALTLTGANSDRILIGGAILPGLKLQLQSLAVETAALPAIELPNGLPNRWSLNTSDAIASGIIYTIVAGIHDFIEDWLARYPDSQIALTGGDAPLLFDCLRDRFPDLIEKTICDRNLIFWGMRTITDSQ